MRLHTLRLRGITEAFPNEVCVDFDTLGPGLIALVGENGAGKLTLIGSIFAALFRQLPGGRGLTLSLEVQVQRGALVRIPTPSSELTRTLEGCERE
jgi:DNA repair exonuclease SbcCD ATPase subunit